MDSVKSFNAELSSLYEFKPPISKAKMTALTRGAIKAIKFYKHVVQSVEKFILKCKPEYKIPGLYVIDSIVRQSRHQFGTDKDVFAPRFAKNIQQTFVNLYKCPPEDKSKIIRVLNLWQKNQVFPPDVVQPLFDLADPNNPIYKELGTPSQANGHGANTLPKGSPALQKTPTKTSQSNESQQGGVNLNLSDPNVLLQLQQLQRLITRSGEPKNDSQVHFDKKLLDFDYGDDEEENNPSPKPVQNNDNSVASLLTNPEVLRQLQTLQQTMAMAQEVDADKLRKLQEMKQQEEEFDKHLAQTVPNLPFASECEFKPNNNAAAVMPPQNYYNMPSQDVTQAQQVVFKNSYDLTQSQEPMIGYESTNNDNDNDVEVITLDHADSSRSPSEERSSRRRRSRSRSRSRDRRGGSDRDNRRSRRSRSRSKRRGRSRSRDRDRGDRKDKEKETERDKERKKRGLPTIKKDNLTVCSTTLWVGHLSKLVHQDDLSNAFGEFGDIVSIDLIPPRGCAFIVMHRRQDAARCLAKLKNHIIHGKAITLAWAPGKGVKGKDLKDYWEGDLGASYIPWSKVKPDIDIDMLEDGGMIDEETMPDWMRAKVEGSAKHQAAVMMNISEMPPQVDTSQPPPMAGAGLLQPPMSLPMVPPFHQFNNRLIAPPNMLNLPPGMMPNVPMGVPPPNLQSQLLTNPLLGIGSPFQGAGLMAPPPLSLADGSQANAETNMKNLTDSLMNLSQTFGLVQAQQSLMQHQQQQQQQHQQQQSQQPDENMDIEMEDAGGRSDHNNIVATPIHNLQVPPPLVNMPPHHQDPRTADRDRNNRDERDNNRGDRRGDRELRDRDNRDRDSRNDRSKDRRRSRSRDRERDRDKDRERDRDRDRNRDRDRRGGSRDRNDRDRDRGGSDARPRDRRDRNRANRWGDREEEQQPVTSDRKDRERSLNERLQEMAGGSRPNRDRKDSSSGQQSNIAGNMAVVTKDNNENQDAVLKEVDKPIIDENSGENIRMSGDFPPILTGPPMSEFPPGAAPIKDFIPPDMNLGPMDQFPPMAGAFGPAGPDNFRGDGPDNFRDGPDNFRDGPDNFREGPDNFRDAPINFRDGPGNFRDGPGNFRDGPGNNFRNGGPGNFRDGPESFRGGPPPGDFRRGGPPPDDFGPPGQNNDFRPPPDFCGPPDDFGPPGGGPEFEPGPGDEFPPGDFRGPRDDFGPPMMMPPMLDDFGPRPMMDDYPDQEFPPHGGRGGRRGGRMMQQHDDRFGRRGGRGRRGDFRGPPRGGARGGGRPDFFDECDQGGGGPMPPSPMMDEFGGPPMQMDDEFGPPPPQRERFGGRGRMRGGLLPPPRDFGGMRGGPPTRGFGRGGPRGRRGAWNDRNFNPRFDGPPEFFRGGPRDSYDDQDGPSPPRRRGGGRFDDHHRGGRPRHDDGPGQGDENDNDDGNFQQPPNNNNDPNRPPGRRSRWGGGGGPRGDSREPDGPPGAEDERGVTPVRDESSRDEGAHAQTEKPPQSDHHAPPTACADEKEATNQESKGEESGGAE